MLALENSKLFQAVMIRFCMQRGKFMRLDCGKKGVLALIPFSAFIYASLRRVRIE